MNRPKNISEEGKWLQTVTYFEATTSVVNITDKNNNVLKGTSRCWMIPNFLPDRIFDKLKGKLELRSQNDIELHVKEVKKEGLEEK